MGIHGLNSYMKKMCHNFIEETSIKSLIKQGIYIYCVDFSLMMCAYTYKYNHDINSIVNAVTFSMKRYIDVGAEIYMVLDGKSHILKKDTQNQRKDHLQNIRKYRTDKIISEMNKKCPVDIDNYIIKNRHMYSDEILKQYDEVMLQTKSPILDKCDLSRIISKLKEVGCLFIQAPGEAEKHCAEICYYNLCHAVISRDSDCLASLTPLIIIDTKLFGDMPCKIIKINKVLSNFQFTKEQFMDFCILLGTDYNKNIPLVGPVKSEYLIRKYKNIENIINNCDFDCTNIQNYTLIRSLLKPVDYTLLNIIYY